MLSDGAAVVFDDPRIPFQPIIEVASSYKLLKKQAAIFELGVGEGGLLVCSLNLKSTDPAGQFLRYRLIEYVSGDGFRPSAKVGPELLHAMQ
jgi:hypothetical protein